MATAGDKSTGSRKPRARSVIEMPAAAEPVAMAVPPVPAAAAELPVADIIEDLVVQAVAALAARERHSQPVY